LFHSVGNREVGWYFAIVKYSGHHVIMELADNLNEMIRAAELGHDFPEAISAHCVERLCQIHEGSD